MPAPDPPQETITAADSPDWSVRAAAGQQLAAWAHQDAIAEILERLLVDRADTAVVVETCLALLRRNDMDGTRLVAQAITTAGELLTTLGLDHIDHLHDALLNYLMPDWLGQVSGLVDDLVILCDVLSQDPDPATAAGAIDLGKWACE